MKQTARDWDPRTHEGLVMIDSGALSTCVPGGLGNPKLQQPDGATFPQRCKQKTAPGVRETTDLAEDLRSDETVRFPCGGRDEIDPECKLSV